MQNPRSTYGDPITKDSMDESYINSGASYHLIPSRVTLHTYQKFIKPIVISAANSGIVGVQGPLEVVGDETGLLGHSSNSSLHSR